MNNIIGRIYCIEVEVTKTVEGQRLTVKMKVLNAGAQTAPWSFWARNWACYS
jgi:hypothetical protein